jgi:hypothetical protein
LNSQIFPTKTPKTFNKTLKPNNKIKSNFINQRKRGFKAKILEMIKNNLQLTQLEKVLALHRKNAVYALTISLMQ